MRPAISGVEPIFLPALREPQIRRSGQGAHSVSQVPPYQAEFARLFGRINSLFGQLGN
jgi:hypothetical protein